MNETIEYRNVEGWPGYRVGNDGTVWSCWTKGIGGKSKLGDQWKLLSRKVRRDGRYEVNLWSNNKGKSMLVSRLVALAFIGPCPKGMDCCHNDGSRNNDRPSNLRWGTRSENMADAKTHGTSSEGTRHGMAKLNESKVAEIRRRCKAGERQREVANYFGLKQQTVSNIVTRRIWKQVEAA